MSVLLETTADAVVVYYSIEYRCVVESRTHARKQQQQQFGTVLRGHARRVCVMHLPRPSDWKIFGVRLISSRLKKMRTRRSRVGVGRENICCVLCSSSSSSNWWNKETKVGGEVGSQLPALLSATDDLWDELAWRTPRFLRPNDERNERRNEHVGIENKQIDTKNGTHWII